jgi:hypothetical protein
MAKVLIYINFIKFTQVPNSIFKMYLKFKTPWWHELNRFIIQYKGRKLPVQFICSKSKKWPPDYFFLVNYPRRPFMVHKMIINRKLYWTCGGNLRVDEWEELGLEIERQSGITLPLQDSDNPFIYTGKKKIKFYSCTTNDITVIKALSPFGRYAYYKIFLTMTPPETFIISENWFFLTRDFNRWMAVEPEVLPGEMLEFLGTVADQAEKLDRWEIYKSIASKG